MKGACACTEAIGPGLPYGSVSGGSLAIYDNIGKGDFIHCNENQPGTYTADGSEVRPYKDLPSAIAAVTGTKRTIILWPGTYDLGSEEITIPTTGDLIVKGFARESTLITCTRNVFAGASLTGNIRFENITIQTTVSDNTGSHTGSDDQSVLTDSGKSWADDEFIGKIIRNLTDGSEGVITDNTGTTITATLSGGTDNDWDNGDLYEIVISAVDVDGIAALKNLYIFNSTLIAPANAYALKLKDMPVSTQSGFDAAILTIYGRIQWDNTVISLHGATVYGIGLSSSQTELDIKGCGGFINDVVVVVQGGQGVVIDNKMTGAGLQFRAHSIFTQSGNEYSLTLLNGATPSYSDLDISNNISSNEILVDASTLNINNAKYDKSDVTLQNGGSIVLHTPASRIDNDSTVSGSTVENALDTLDSGKEPAFSKNTAFNKNFGTGSGTVCEGNDSRLSVIWQADLSLAGATPAASDVSSWPDGARGIGIGTDSSYWLIYRIDGSNIKSVQLT